MVTQTELRSMGIQQRVVIRESIQKQKQAQAQQQGISTRVNQIIEDINSGKISSYSQIPTDLRKYVNVDQSYFTQRQQYQVSLQQSQAASVRLSNLRKAEALARKGLSAIYVQDLPKYAREHFREIKQGIKSQQVYYAAKEVAYFKGGLGYSMDPGLAKPGEVPTIVFSATGYEAPKYIQKQNVDVLQSYTPIKIQAKLPGISSSIVPSILQKQKYSPESYLVSRPPSKKQSKITKALNQLYFGAKKITDVEVPIPKPTSIITPGAGGIGKVKLGDIFFKGRKAVSKLSDITTIGLGYLAKDVGIETEKTLPKSEVPIYLSETRIGTEGQFGTPTTISLPERKEDTFAGTMIKGFGKSPEILAYGYAPYLTLGGDIAVGVKEESPGQVAIATGFIGLGLGGKAIKYLNKPIITETVTSRIPAKSTFVEIQKSIDIAGKDTTKSFFVIKQTPQIERGTFEITSRFRKLVRKGPKISGTFKDLPTAKYTTPVSPIIGEGDYFAQTTRKGISGKLGKPKIVYVSGKQNILSVEELRQFKVPEYQLKELIRQTKTGVPVKDPSLFVKEGEQLSLGTVREAKLSGFTPGKRRKQISVVGIVEEGKKLPSGVEIFKAKAGFKDVTKPFSRATGKIDTLEGKIIKLPRAEVKGKGIEFIQPGGGPKTPLSVTFGDTKQVQAFKVFPKLPKPKKTPTVKTTTVTKEELPKMVGGTGLTFAPYQGTGLYETTESVSVLGVKSKGISGVGILPEVKVLSTTRTDLEIKSGSLPMVKSLAKTETIAIEKPKLIEKTKQVSGLKLSQISKQTLKQIAKALPKLKQKSTPKTKPPTIPKPKPSFTPLPSAGKTKATKVSKRGVFTALGKRFGKEVKLGTRTTQAKAEKVLEKFLGKTLGASGAITESGKKIKAEELLLLSKKGFRKSKVSKFTIVEVKERRLKKKGAEVKEIQSFKKKSRKKNIFGI